MLTIDFALTITEPIVSEFQEGSNEQALSCLRLGMRLHHSRPEAWWGTERHQVRRVDAPGLGNTPQLGWLLASLTSQSELPVSQVLSCVGPLGVLPARFLFLLSVNLLHISVG